MEEARLLYKNCCWEDGGGTVTLQKLLLGRWRRQDYFTKTVAGKMEEARLLYKNCCWEDGGGTVTLQKMLLGK